MIKVSLVPVCEEFPSGFIRDVPVLHCRGNVPDRWQFTPGFEGHKGGTEEGCMALASGIQGKVEDGGRHGEPWGRLFDAPGYTDPPRGEPYDRNGDVVALTQIEQNLASMNPQKS